MASSIRITKSPFPDPQHPITLGDRRIDCVVGKTVDDLSDDQIESLRKQLVGFSILSPDGSVREEAGERAEGDDGVRPAEDTEAASKAAEAAEREMKAEQKSGAETSASKAPAASRTAAKPAAAKAEPKVARKPHTARRKR